jgi:hypothetical protein
VKTFYEITSSQKQHKTNHHRKNASKEKREAKTKRADKFLWDAQNKRQ